MRKKRIIFSFLATGLLFLSVGVVLKTLPLLKASKSFGKRERSLKVLTYSSFSGVYGPGKVLKEKFEVFCDCQVQWFLVEDSTMLLQRFSLLSGIDVVIGWDQITGLSLDRDLWEDLSSLKKKWIDDSYPLFSKNPYLLPLDWSPIGFISREASPSPFSLKKLPAFSGKISFPEPRTSTLGLQFYYWIYEIFDGDKEEIATFLSRLKDKVYGPVFSWSLAYGFFQKGQTDIGLSYLSSLLYHQKEEPEKPYFFLKFKEAHPYQVEFLSLSKTSQNKTLALEFIEFLLQPDIQSVIQNRNYMFPVSKKASPPDLLLEQEVPLISYKRLPEFIKEKKTLLELWEKHRN